MHSVYSYKSKVSQYSQDLIEAASRTSKFGGIGLNDDTEQEEMMSKVWGAFGLFISRQMRMGRGVTIPHFGTFTFSAPEVLLDGVTNPQIRDKQCRNPVFIVSKEFVKGKQLQTGIYVDNHIRPFNIQTSGKIQQVKVNYTEIGYLGQTTKDIAKYSVDRMIRVLSDKTRVNQHVDMEIPGVGVFQNRPPMVAVRFLNSFISNTKAMPKRPLSERKQKGNMELTAEALSALNFHNTIKENLPTTLDDTGKDYLKNQYNFEIQSQSSLRPSTAGNSRIMSKLGQQTKKSATLISKRPQTAKGTVSNKDFQVYNANLLSNIEYGMKRLRFWLRQNYYRSEDGFLEMCNQAFGRTLNQRIKISFQKFYEAADKMELLLNPEQCAELFAHLDVNGDGFISFDDWRQIIRDDNQHVHYIKDVIYKRQLHADDILKTMGFNRERQPVGVDMLTHGLKTLDITLNEQKARIVALGILDGDKTISMQGLIELLSCLEEDDKTFNPSWFKDILYKIKQRLLGTGSFDTLKRVFEKYDEHNIGSLDTANFKTVLMQSNLRLEVKDINRVVRYLPKVGSNRIDYYNFLLLVERIDITSSAPEIISDTRDFAEKLANLLKRRKVDIVQFLKTIRTWAISNGDQVTENGEVSVEQVSDYLYKFVFYKTDKLDLDNFVEELDLDSDGFIKENDVRPFLTKYQYFDEIWSAPNCSTRNLQVYKNPYMGVTLNSKSLYPFEPLIEEKVDQVLIGIRKKLDFKKMGLVQLFKLLDSDQDGFITIEEFSKNIDQITPLSQPIKDGFFAFMDKQHIGMIDMSQFIKIMQKSIVNPLQNIEDDNFNWENNQIFKIRDWFFFEKLTVEDAFRTLDSKYKGFIEKEDLHEFLGAVLKVKKEDISQGRINRLFKIMDIYKRGRITVDDFRRFLCEDFEQGLNQTVMGNQSIINYSSFDWKLNAKQQLGIVLTRRFNNLIHSFDTISGFKKKLLYEQFSKWVEANLALRGFDLSEKLKHELFSDLDPHKKGYLTESDWENAFKGYNWKDQVMDEVQEMVQKNFENEQKAYKFFCQQNKNQIISFKSFKLAINFLFPRRFIESDILDMWILLSEHSQTVDYSRFLEIFYKQKQGYYETYADMTQRPLESMGNMSVDGKSLREVTEMGAITEIPPFSKEHLLDRIRRFLRSCNQDPKVQFEEADQDNSGWLTNLEFKNAMKKLNFALTNSETDILINLCGADGKIQWRNFLYLIKLRETDQRIVDRAKVRLQHISEMVYTYMLSPKDAFRMFDKNAEHTLDFEQFQNFIREISFLSNEDVPPYSIIKDMFEYIDKRRDGIIDMTEWMDVFQSFEYKPKATVFKSKVNKNYNFLKRPNSSQGPSRRLPYMGMGGGPLSTKHSEKSNTLNKSSENFMSLRQLSMKSGQKRPCTAINNRNQNFLLTREFKMVSPQEKYESMRLGQWESSKEFDKILTAIGRNRKFLLDIFQSYQNMKKPITYQMAKAVIEQMLRNGGIEVKDDGWPVLLKFAEKDGIIDYKFLLDVYKERIKAIDTHPRSIQQELKVQA
uniref:EF hand family protein n=1 Tax=Philasterides dicentrarchi TaxID=282688 RepID=A0A481SAS2_9CILI|nr:EF hand family protein [Philasterides dicentrarchi]